MNPSNFPRHIITAAACITNAQGHVLMVNSPRRGWEFPGGQIEEGETLIEGLQREILEETGVTATIGTLVGIYSNISPPTKVTFGFLGQWESGNLITSPESVETAWFPRAEVLAKITHPAIHARMQDMLEFSGRVIYRVYAVNPYCVYETRFL